ncbi:TonB-dependent receptor plug [Opitutus terrae PB90-1]|uniref:TonB-dependent receptor plug n=2 Tax=Opitutus terrae TaxID=107709 RepID=B1ZP63_OPITP|nr:TonB-dependent receptor plug [Opitutus terrae PB90-1]
MPACLFGLAITGWAQQAASTPAQPEDDEVIVLSPFDVVSDTKGYYSANTMSGTRFNTKLADLASSVTVMTKAQMNDFAMIDANDIFLYAANTEGTGTYTDYTLDRNGSIGDNVQANPTGANRVRGIAPANVSLSNFETMNRVPVDSVEVESVEISRGPNANVFGLGNPSGTINLVPTAAILTRDRVSAEARADSYGGWRTSLDVNQVLIKNKLAVRFSGVFQQDEFEREPSGVKTERYKGMIKYRPFKNTTITGSIGYYHAYGNRPNAIPPRDNLSYWIASGKPTWDPVTMTVYLNDAPVGTYTANNYNGPYFTSAYLGNNRNQMFIDRDGLVYWSAPQIVTNATNPTANAVGQRYLQPAAAAGPTFSGTAPRPFDQPLFNTTPTVSDKSIYDWSSINLSSPNSFWDKTTTSLFQIDQIILDTPMQTLAAQAAFFREESERWTNNVLGTINDNGQSGQLTVDINRRLLDGSPNPFYLRPYVASDRPRMQYNPQKWDTTRGQLAYRLNLTDQDNLLKWLGWFQITGYGEYKYRMNRQYSWRDAMISPVSWIPAGTYVGSQSSPSGSPPNLAITTGLQRYYVGDTNGNNVDYAPATTFENNQTYPFVWVSRTGSGTAAAPYVFTSHTDNILIGPAAADKSGRFSGDFNSKTTLKTAGVVGQSHLFNDRLITTVGWRNDSLWTKLGNPGNPRNAVFQADGITFNHDVIDHWDANYFKNGGHTTNVQFVVRPFTGMSWVNQLQQNGRGGQFLSELLNGLSVNSNKSNSFLPTNPAQDLNKNLLPNTTGTDKSWGLGLSLFGDKLQIRATRYDNKQTNAQTNDMSTMAGRVLRMDFPVVGAGSPTGSHNLYYNAQRWVTWQNPGWSTAQVEAEVERQTGLSAENRDYYSNASPGIGATTDIRSTGTEIEINYNPTNFWTVAASITKTKSVNTNVSRALVDWIETRRDIWTSIVDPSITDANAADEGNPGKLWWKHRYTQLAVGNSALTYGTPASYTASAATPEQNFIAFVDAPFAVMRELEGKSNPQIRPWAFRASTSVQLGGLFDNKHLKRMSVGGALRWEDKGAIGYYGVQQLPAIITQLDVNRPIYDETHTYVDLFASYKVKLWNDKVVMTLKANVRNLGETGRLQPVGAFPDGTIHTYRIIDPQLFILTASFDL